jgi:manganese transport protein
VRTVLQVALGIIAAIGGFLDIGDLVFTSQAGATYGYATLWALPIGILGIMVFAEMSGRVAAIGGKPNMELVRDRYPQLLSRFTLVASLVLTVVTLAAELGGLAFVLNYFFDVSVPFFVLVAMLFVAATAFLLPFEWLERLYGYLGLALVVYIASTINLNPDWHDVADGFVPRGKDTATYWYFVVGLIAATFMPYEIYFYSSGAIEEGWGKSDLKINKLNAIVGFGLGGLLSIALVAAAAATLLPRGISPDSIGTVALIAQVPYGEVGLLLAFLGIAFAVGGATIDCAFSAAYNLAQHEGWKWGKRNGLETERRFTFSLAAFFLIAFAIIQTGVDPVELTEYAVIFSVPVIPLTYLPVLLAGNDRQLMGDEVNGVLARVLGWAYFALICVLAVAAPVLFVATNGGG